MTTLPPEDQNGPEAGAPGQPEQQPEVPQAPQAPQTPQAPTPPPAQTAPPQPQYQAPPQQPGYQAPPQPGYQQPAGGYQQPAGGYQQPVASDPAGTITLNYWLSVFFTWIPALIFFLMEKDKGNQQATEFHRENLNFSLLRTGLYVAIVIASFIPYLNLILVPILWIAQIVAFVFHIIAAVKAPEAYRTGQRPGFILNIPFIR